MQEGQKCGLCVFVERDATEVGGKGLCRKGPPTVFVQPVQGPIPGSAAIQKLSVYPPVTLSDRGCGDFIRDRSRDIETGEV